MGTGSSVNSRATSRASSTRGSNEIHGDVAAHRHQRTRDGSRRSRTSNTTRENGRTSSVLERISETSPTTGTGEGGLPVERVDLPDTRQIEEERHSTDEGRTVTHRDSTIGSRTAVNTPSAAVNSSNNLSQHVMGEHNSQSVANTSTAHPKMVKITTQEHVHLIETTFELLAKEFGVYFEIDQIVSTAGIINTEPSTVIIEAGSEPLGIYIIADGTYSQIIPDTTMEAVSMSDDHNQTAATVPMNGRTQQRLGELSEGEMFGELATLMDIPNIMTIKCEESGILIKVPIDSVRENISGKVLKTRARSWCVRRAHVYTSGLFDNSGLVLLITVSAIKSSKQFSEWSHESLEYMSKLCQLTLFDSNEELYRSGESPFNLFIIIRGRVRERSIGSQQFEDISVKNTNGSRCIGDKDFFLKQTRKQTALSLSPSLVVPLSREAILATIDEFEDEKTKVQRLLSMYKNDK